MDRTTRTKKRLRRRWGGDLGFTLIELAVVIAIIAILVGIAVPVLLLNRKKADHAVAINNLMVAARVADAAWFTKLATQTCPLENGAYRDYNPPDELKGGVGSDGYVPVDAKYWSIAERKMYWVDLDVGGASGPLASADIGPYAQAEGYGFRVAGVWHAGREIASGPDMATDWSQLPGRVGVVDNTYWWEGGWHANTENQYLTLMTYEPVGIAHFYTLNVGVTVAGGTFNWNNGSGTPGESFGDELASQPPPADNNPPSNPPGDVTQPTPPGDVTPPPTPPPTTPEPPPQTQPAPPPQTQPEPPPNVPPPGENQATNLSITPTSLNVDARGVFDVYITLKSGYDPYHIDHTSVRAYQAAPVNFQVTGNGLHMTFLRSDLRGLPIGNSVLFIVTGLYFDHSAFQGWDYVKTIDNH
jgi:prepilin-type N-terminal cleavage/methylation domain-containing protein